MKKIGIKYFRHRLLKLRNERKLTQSELGKLIHRSYSTISLYENGNRIPNIKIAYKLAKALNVSIGYLIEGK